MMSTKLFTKITLLCVIMTMGYYAQSHIPPGKNGITSTTITNSRSSDCVEGKAETNLDVNNVRARLRIGGDIWWNGTDGKYVVPKVIPGSGQREVSSIFAGGVWLGGQQLGGDLFVAASAYGGAGKDFYPGPLFDGTSGDIGETDQQTCEDWDRFFEVSGADITQFRADFDESPENFDCNKIPTGLKGWPAKGNPFFFEVHGFELPDNNAGLAGFLDKDDDGLYDPCKGDYPIIEIRKCPQPNYADQMIFWIYNDNGNAHRETQGDAIRMEVQSQSFAYATADEINDMTFYRYKMINRANEPIDSFHFAMWIDPDLGCPDDDYIGCDTSAEFMYVYNVDEIDGITGDRCPVGGQNIPTYGSQVPMLGVDYFEGPLDEFGKEIGMTSFMYYNRTGSGPAGTLDPTGDVEYYRYLTGTWQDGTPLTIGGDGKQNTGLETRYAFFSPPNEVGGWSMCEENIGAGGDRRTLQTSGPFKLEPGANNFLIVGVVWVPDYDLPCPSINRLLEADAIAQNLFDACFEITDGPSAPDLEIIELDEQLILVLTNKNSSNNTEESYTGKDLKAPEGTADSLYKFEGYVVYQVFNGTSGELDDPDYARIIANYDVENGVTSIYNWIELTNPDPVSTDQIFIPVLQVEGNDSGIKRTINVTSDAFSFGGNTELVNNRNYYFSVVAYAYNNYQQFDVSPDSVGASLGQRSPYLLGRLNFNDQSRDGLPYVGTPHKLLNVHSNSFYGEGIQIDMLAGQGVGGQFVDITDETRLRMAMESFDGTISFEKGEAPIEVFVYNPIDVKDGDYEIRFLDSNGNNEVDDEDKWELENLTTGDTVLSTNVIGGLFEQIFRDAGISVSLRNTVDFDDDSDKNEGLKYPIGSEIEYANEDIKPWFGAITTEIGARLQELNIPFSEFFVPGFDFLATDQDSEDANFDPLQVMGKIGTGEFVPFHITRWNISVDGEAQSFLTPQYTETRIAINVRQGLFGSKYKFSDMPNVDIVMTSDRSLWSKCIVVEGATKMYSNEGWESVDRVNNFVVRKSSSLLKDVDSDGLIQYHPTETGFSWFPGYAVNIETGDRLNIFFAENSAYAEHNSGGNPAPGIFRFTGDDMMWNPTTDILLPPIDNDPANLSIFNYIAGCQHNIYITSTKYDSCQVLATQFERSSAPRNSRGLADIVWTSMPLINPEAPLMSYADGLIPDDVTIKLRVNNPFRKQDLGYSINNDFPVFQFGLEGKEAEELSEEGVETALDNIRAVPNPYYAYSEYEVSALNNIVKITNLPAECLVTIYTLDGKFIREYRRNEARIPNSSETAGVPAGQYVPDVQWDLKNYRGIPIASGVYLIHINAPGLGERVIKWFGVARQFDASGL